MIFCNGGVMNPVPTGNTLKDRKVPLKEKKNIRLFMLFMKMLKPMQNGQEKDFPPKPNGNLLQEAENPEIYMRGAMI